MFNVREAKVSLLKPWEDNPRLNNEAIDTVVESIKTFGFNVPILCDQQFTIIAGHTRWKAAKKIGLELVPVIILELDETQRKAFAIADNKTGEIASWDYPKLPKILKELQYNKINLPSLGYSQAELQSLLTQQKEFDWKAFEEQFKSELTSMYVLFPIKVPVKMKEVFKKAIIKIVNEHGIKEKDLAKAAGQAIGLLLGVSQ